MGGKSSFIRLVKMVFLYKSLVESKKLDTFYEFVPYKYGPYSFNLHNELKGLIKNGYLYSKDNKTIQINHDLAIPSIGLQFEEEIRYFINEYSKLPDNKLSEHVYSRFPWFTINAAKIEKRRVSRPKASELVYTIGYEGLQIDAFLNILLMKGIQQVIDVRSNPVSRQYGYHKATLMKLCNSLSIKYLHYPELGITSERRTTIQDTESLQRLLTWYRNEVTTHKRKSIKLVEDEIMEKPSVLLCMEADPTLCHRFQLAKIISKETGLMIYDLRRSPCKTALSGPRFL